MRFVTCWSVGICNCDIESHLLSSLFIFAGLGGGNIPVAYTGPAAPVSKLANKDDGEDARNALTPVRPFVFARVFLVTDKQGESACMTVYNMAPEQLTQGDVLQMDPKVYEYKHVSLALGDQQVAFKSLRINDPAPLWRNGRPLG